MYGFDNMDDIDNMDEVADADSIENIGLDVIPAAKLLFIASDKAPNQSDHAMHIAILPVEDLENSLHQGKGITTPTCISMNWQEMLLPNTNQHNQSPFQSLSLDEESMIDVDNLDFDGLLNTFCDMDEECSQRYPDTITPALYSGKGQRITNAVDVNSQPAKKKRVSIAGRTTSWNLFQHVHSDKETLALKEQWKRVPNAEKINYKKTAKQITELRKKEPHLTMDAAIQTISNEQTQQEPEHQGNGN
jgi:hypothetical protein